MQIGDLIQWRESETEPYRLWLVSKIDANLNTALLVSERHRRRVLGLEAEVLVVCRPVSDWHQVTLPLKRGRISRLMFGPTELLWLHEWVKMDEFQMGGVVYINPTVGLRYGQKLTVFRDRGASIVVPVPRLLSTGKQKEAARVAAEEAEREPPPPAEGIYGILRQDDDYE